MHKASHREYSLKLLRGTWQVARAVIIGTVAGLLILILALTGALFRWVANHIESLSTNTEIPANPINRKEII